MTANRPSRRYPMNWTPESEQDARRALVEMEPDAVPHWLEIRAAAIRYLSHRHWSSHRYDALASLSLESRKD